MYLERDLIDAEWDGDAVSGAALAQAVFLVMGRCWVGMQ